MQTKSAIRFDPQDGELMEQLMREYGNSNAMFWGETEAGETFTISISRESIATATFLDNNRARRNVYYRDGSSEEFFED